MLCPVPPTYHGCSESEAFLHSLDDVLVWPVPVGSLAIRHHLPHHNAVAPAVWRRRELAVGNCLWSRPPHRDLASLQDTIARYQHIESLLGRPGDSTVDLNTYNWRTALKVSKLFTSQEMFLFSLYISAAFHSLIQWLCHTTIKFLDR